MFWASFTDSIIFYSIWTITTDIYYSVANTGLASIVNNDFIFLAGKARIANNNLIYIAINTSIINIDLIYTASTYSVFNNIELFRTTLV